MGYAAASGQSTKPQPNACQGAKWVSSCCAARLGSDAWHHAAARCLLSVCVVLITSSPDVFWGEQCQGDSGGAGAGSQSDFVHVSDARFRESEYAADVWP